MFDPAANPHPELSFALDVADKAIKLLAVLLGVVWTWWNYKKSRTYAQKLDLQIAGAVFLKDGLCVEVMLGLKNLGSSRHLVQQRGSSCIITAIFDDMSERTVRTFAVFTGQDRIEPGETIIDPLAWWLSLDPRKIVWLKVHLRVVSGSVEWLIRVDTNAP
jgi:hypothetical protein